MKQSILYKKLKNNLVQCQTCSHYCIIAPEKTGLCQVRKNISGKLYLLNYRKVVALNIDPVEKKPLFHFLPGTKTLSLGYQGCNFKCLHCQNYEISQHVDNISTQTISPEEIVKTALDQNLPSISYTYTEPTIFLESALETMKLAHQKGLKNIWVSNGFFSEKTFQLCAPYLDAINIDLKFFQNKLYQKTCHGKLNPILENLKRVKNNNIWLEVTTLLIPGYTDQDNQIEKIADFIKNELGDNVPWHISSFYPCYKMENVSPTPLKLMFEAEKIGKRAGLKYVYLGNITEQEKQNTYCPYCQELLVKRSNYFVESFINDVYCPKCKKKIDFIIK